MGKGQWRLKVSGDFSSSHQLRHYEGKCENMHGHNFEVEVDVVGESLDPKLGILMDFKELKRLLKTVTDELDHRHLNELQAFAEHNPVLGASGAVHLPPSAGAVGRTSRAPGRGHGL